MKGWNNSCRSDNNTVGISFYMVQMTSFTSASANVKLRKEQGAFQSFYGIWTQRVINICPCVQVLLPSPLRLPDGQWLEEKEGTDGARRLLRAGVAALCLHRHWQQRPRNATAQLRGKGTTHAHTYCGVFLLTEETNIISKHVKNPLFGEKS